VVGQVGQRVAQEATASGEEVAVVQEMTLPLPASVELASAEVVEVVVEQTVLPVPQGASDSSTGATEAQGPSTQPMRQQEQPQEVEGVDQRPAILGQGPLVVLW